MKYYAALDPGESPGFALIVSSTSVLTADSKEDIFHYLEQLKGKDYVIGLEKVHAVWGSGAGSTFSFGLNYGFWIGVLKVLGLEYTDVTTKEWQDAVINKPAKPPIPKGLTKYQVQKIKRLHKDLIKQESCRAAHEAFPRSTFEKHDICDAVNMARYLRHVYNKGNKNGKKEREESI